MDISDASVTLDRLTADEVATAVGIANVPALLMVVYQFTGDEKWLQSPYLPTRGKGLTDHDDGGLPAEVQEEIRRAATDVILRLQSGEKPAIVMPSDEQTTRMMSVCMGEPVGEEYGPMLSSEIARRVDPHLHELQMRPIRVSESYKILVVGTGIAGIAAAQQLEDMGVDYTMLEKQPEPGGNWFQNTYPGAGVDTPSHLYSFSFAKNDWAKHFELRDDLQRYFHRVMKDLGALQRVRFDTEVLSSTYRDSDKRWEVRIRNSHGHEETLVADVVISAVGVLNKKRMPDVANLELFQGVQFHSSDWPDDLELEGKRVAVVGTGASSMQISPAIASRVEHLTIFQRSPQWVAPFEKFLKPIPAELRMLMQSCPLYHAWYWIRLFWQFGDKVIEALRIDPDWEHPERSVNARNDGHREYFTRYLTKQLEHRPDLIEKALPSYPPFGKRILLDNGWFATIQRDNVSLVTEYVTEVTRTGLIDGAGQEHEVDVIVWATGFQAARFVSSMDVRGADGLSLREAWDDDNPKAFLGVSVPGFPNFFMLGGPNSFPGSGSFMYFMEVQMRYLRELLTIMAERGITAVDATETANTTYNELVDSTHSRTVWTHPGMQTYYRNSRGRVVFVMPFLNVEYWNMTNELDLADYTLR
ncbi:MAG TPA: NAD(P)/FAD-dependent oxidoreductase [Kribbella sp.]